MIRITLPLLALLAALLPAPAMPASAEMVQRDNFRLLPTSVVEERRADCGPFAGNPDALVYQLVTGSCDYPGARWEMAEVAEVQVTRAWAKLGYLAYQVRLEGLADDSLAAVEYRFELTPLEDQAWQLDFAGERWRCHQDRGRSDAFTTKPCI